MGITALSPVQAAVSAALTGDVTLMAMITGVFDQVPDGQAYRYITIGETTENRWDTLGKRGRDQTLTLHIWGQDPGFKQLQLILARMDTLLDGAALSVAGFSTVFCQFENARQIKNPDGYTRQIAVRYRVVVVP